MLVSASRMSSYGSGTSSIRTSTSTVARPFLKEVHRSAARPGCAYGWVTSSYPEAWAVGSIRQCPRPGFALPSVAWPLAAWVTNYPAVGPTRVIRRSLVNPHQYPATQSPGSSVASRVAPYPSPGSPVTHGRGANPSVEKRGLPLF